MQVKRQAVSPEQSAWRQEWAVQQPPPAWILSAVNNGRTLAQLLYQRQPDRSAFVSFFNHVPELVEPEAWTALFLQVIDDAKSDGVTSVTVLPFADFPVGVEASLTSSGFSKTGRIEQWQRALGPTTTEVRELPFAMCQLTCQDTMTDTLTFDLLRPADGTGHDDRSIRFSRSHVTELIGDALQNSLDFPGLPTPDADGLLSTWELIDSEVQIVLAAEHDVAVGLLVLNQNTQTSHVPRSEVTIEYIGVHSQYRRRGIGNWLMKSAMRDRFEKRFKTMMAFVAAANHPARRFYQHLQFHCVDESNFWTAVLAGH